MILSLTACSGPYSTLDPAGPHAQSVAYIWWGMFWFGTFVTIFMTLLWWHAMRRNGSDTPDNEVQGKQNSWVIWGGIALPVGAITLLLAFGIPAGHRMLPFDGDDVVHIEVTSHQWFWQVYYPDLDITLIDEIHIPVDTPINFHIRSDDVIHSFWVPRLGGKVDAIPGRTNVLRLQASKTGRFEGQCAEYCGVGHAHMDFAIHAHSADDFASWQETVVQGDRP